MTPTPHDPYQARVGVADEVLEGRSLAILLAHEQQRNERREQDRAGGQLELLERHQLAQAFATHSVPHLVVVLRKDHEPVRRYVTRGSAVPPLPVG